MVGSEFQVNIGSRLRDSFVTIMLKNEENGTSEVSGTELKSDSNRGSDDRARATLLRTLAKELSNLINSDIIPRWTNHANGDTIDRYLSNMPVHTFIA